jgi:Domain of unknown function (DUF1883)
MRYAYSDLGNRRQGCSAVVRWSGAPATVMLFDPVNFAKYLRRMPCHCDEGARYRHSPARLSIPEDGRWYAVVDYGGYSSRTAPTIEVLDPENGSRSPTD